MSPRSIWSTARNLRRPCTIGGMIRAIGVLVVAATVGCGGSPGVTTGAGGEGPTPDHIYGQATHVPAGAAGAGGRAVATGGATGVETVTVPTGGQGGLAPRGGESGAAGGALAATGGSPSSGGAGGTGSALGTGGAPPPPALLVMPVGDSITVDSAMTGPGGYRAPLFELLNAVQPTRLIGKYTTGGGPGAHVGVDNLGIHAFQPGGPVIPTTWADEFAAFGTPDVALVYLGTNNSSPELLVPELVDPILAANGTTRILVAPLFQRVVNDHKGFDAYEVAAVEAHPEYGRRVFLARSMPTCLTLADLSPDGIHPSRGGYQKMAACWFAEMKAQGLLSTNGGR